MQSPKVFHMTDDSLNRAGYTDPVFLHFEVSEPPSLSMASFKVNLDDLGALVILAQVIETRNPRVLASSDRARGLLIRQASYGSPFVIDAEIIHSGEQVIVGATAVGVLLHAYLRSFKTLQDGRKTAAEAAAIRGREKREQIRFNREDAELVLLEACNSLEEEKVSEIVRWTFDPKGPASANNPGQIKRILKTLWRLAQKDSVSFRVKN